MPARGVHPALGGTLTPARARRVQAMLLGYFAYCIGSAVVLWTMFDGALATPAWIVLCSAPVVVLASRRSVVDLVRPLVAGSGRDDLARELGPLEYRSYVVRHDIDLGRGVLDHLVVGPSGVYAIERSAWPGRFELKGTKLTHSGLSARRVVDRACRAAELVSRRLALAGIDAPVTAVVALTRSEQTAGTISLRRVSVLRADDLAAWIHRRPVLLETLDLDRVRAALT
jgi:hypothetical protein